MAIVSSLHHNQRRSRSTVVVGVTSVQYCGSNPSPDIKAEPHTLPVCSSTLTSWGPRSQPQHYESREQHPPCSKSQHGTPFFCFRNFQKSWRERPLTISGRHIIACTTIVSLLPASLHMTSCLTHLTTIDRVGPTSIATLFFVWFLLLISIFILLNEF